MYNVVVFLLVLSLIGTVIPFLPGVGRFGFFILAIGLVALASAIRPDVHDRTGSAGTNTPQIASAETRTAAVTLDLARNTPGIVVTEAEYGRRWPYYASSTATLRCTRGVEPGTGGRPIATIEVSGGVFGLNGAAMGVGGFPSDGGIRRRNEWGAPVAGPLGRDGFLDRALTLCGG
jgi:hypothetical protein